MAAEGVIFLLRGLSGTLFPNFFTAFPSITENILSASGLRLHTAIFNS